MGYRRGGAPRVRAGTDRDESGAGTSGATVHTGAGSALASEYDGAAAPGEGGYFRESPRKARKKRVWLRAVFCVFLVAEIVIAFVVEEYSPVFNFEITTVTGTGDTEAFGSNPDLLYPIKLGGSLCRPSDLAPCILDDAPTATLTTVCCRELKDPSSSGPEEYVSAWAAFGYVVIIPALILIVRGFLLGRVWAMKPFREPPCVKAEAIEEEGDGAWGKKRWHLRVGFYAIDACLGLLAAQATTLLITYVLKVCVGRPRPNYFALRFFSDHAANGQNFDHESVLSWPSGHTATSMAGLLFLAYVLWCDLMALVKWRRRAHPKTTLILAVLGGFVIVTLPLSGFLVGVTRIRDYWHRPDDVLAGLVLGMVCAHWSFRFMVLMPFSHEVGSPQWTSEPAWVEEEERKWEEEEEEFRMCPWRYRPGAPRKRVASVEAANKAARRFPGEVMPPVRAPEADAIMGVPPV